MGDNMDKITIGYYKSIFWKENLKNVCVGFSEYSGEGSLENIKPEIIKKALECAFDYADIIINGKYIGSLINNYPQILKQNINHTLTTKKKEAKYAFVNNIPELLINIGHASQLSPLHVTECARFNIKQIKKELRSINKYKILFSVYHAIEDTNTTELLNPQNTTFVSWDGNFFRIGFVHANPNENLIEIIKNNYDKILDNLLSWIDEVESFWSMSLIEKLIKLREDLKNNNYDGDCVCFIHSTITELHQTLLKHALYFGIKKLTKNNKTRLEFTEKSLYYINGRKRISILNKTKNNIIYNFWNTLNNKNEIIKFIDDSIEILLNWDDQFLTQLTKNPNLDHTNITTLKNITDRTFLNEKITFFKIPEEILYPELITEGLPIDIIDELLTYRYDLEHGNTWIKWDDYNWIHPYPVKPFFKQIHIPIESLNEHTSDFNTLISLVKTFNKNKLLRVSIKYEKQNKNYPTDKLTSVHNIKSLTLTNNKLTITLKTINSNHTINQLKNETMNIINKLWKRYKRFEYVTKLLKAHNLLNKVNKQIPQNGITEDTLKDLLEALIYTANCIHYGIKQEGDTTVKLDKNTTITVKNNKLYCKIKNKTYEIFELDDTGEIINYTLFTSYKSLTHSLKALTLLINTGEKTVREQINK